MPVRGDGQQGPLVVRVEVAPDEGHVVLAPALGVWHAPPAEGDLLGPLARLGWLERVGRRRPLHLPVGVVGRVVEAPSERVVPVEYGQRLLRLASLGKEARSERRPGSRSVASAPGFDVVSPVDGVFYRGPGPQAPPFVEVGTRLRAGQPIGLVEVMKTFNQVLYGAIGLPDEAVVLEVRCGDAEEVRAGQTLLIVR